MNIFLKRAVAIAIIICLGISLTHAMTPREKNIGPKLGYISENNSVVAGLVFRYNFSEHLRISPEVGCAFRHDNRDAFLADLNFHTPFRIAETGKAAIYPLAGLTFNAWSHHGKYEHLGEMTDVSTHINRFGLNAGAGFELNCSPTLNFGIEAKYSIVKSYSFFIITAGISYIF